MPATWYNRHAVNTLDNEETKQFYRSIVADKKPYFMRYIYPQLKKQYNNYIKNTDKNALREFGATVEEIKRIPDEYKSERQKEFLSYYNYRMPVGMNDCVMNKICRRFEEEFDGILGRMRNNDPSFDYSVMKSGIDYSQKLSNKIRRLFDEYNKRLSNYLIFSEYEKVDDADKAEALNLMNEDFRRECNVLCPNRTMLGDIILDICYNTSSTKRFAWQMCSDEIIDNLLEKNNNTLSYPTLDVDGDIRFGGNQFTIKYKEVDKFDYSS